MRAHAGERIVIRAPDVAAPERDCEVVEVHGQDGAPPYVVRWSGSGQDVLFFPGPDARVGDDARERT